MSIRWYFLVAWLLGSAAVAAEDGPFGLIWGMSEQALRKQGTQLKTGETYGELKNFTTKSLPKNHSLAEGYLLVVHSTRGLQKVVMLSKNIASDPFGSEGKARYSELKSILEEKYGSPTHEMEWIGLTLFKESDEFYQCLAYNGCGMWASSFAGPQDISVVLQLKGLDRGSGYFELSYEGPKWSMVLDELKQENLKADTDAL